MSDQNPKDLQDKERRNLLVATGGVGALGACAFVTPMVASFAPSVRAKASGGPVEVEIGDAHRRGLLLRRLVLRWLIIRRLGLLHQLGGFLEVVLAGLILLFQRLDFG